MKTYLTKTCKFCNTQFETQKADKEFCSGNHQTQYKNSLKQKVFSHVCTFCNKSFESNRSKTMMCSDQCRIDSHVAKKREEKREQNNKLYENVADIPTCKICGWKSRHLTTHLRCHDISVDEYRQQYNATDADLFHSSYMQHLSDKMVGDKNPGFQHGGTMSSFSKKFRKYENLTEEEKEKEIQSKYTKIGITKRANNSYTTTLEYYTSRGYTDEEAAIALVERQTTFSKKICIEQYGEEEGLRVWTERQQKWKQSLDALPEEVKQRIKEDKMKGLQLSQRRTSKVSSELFDYLSSFSGLYGVNEQVITFSDGTYCFPDFLYNDKIIEFNGDYWHANPKKYKETDIIRIPGTNNSAPAREIWEREEKRSQNILKEGYKLLVIWESEYNSDKLGTIRKCIDFLRT